MTATLPPLPEADGEIKIRGLTFDAFRASTLHAYALAAIAAQAQPAGVQVLIDFATGLVHHIDAGGCPDFLEGHNSRDPDCPVCRAIDAAVPAPIVVQPDVLAALRRVVAADAAHATIHATDGDDVARMVEWAEAFDEARAVLAAPAVLAVQPTPPGWKLVPVEPTNAMVSAGYEHTLREIEDDDDSDGANEFYRARGQAIAAYTDMLAAAPEHGISAPVVPTLSPTSVSPGVEPS